MSLHDHVVMAGYLDKSPPIGKGSILKSVKRRWFVLRSDTAQFTYYVDTDTKKQPKGQINMEDVVKIEGHQKWPLGKKEKHPWVFTIENVKGRVFFLSTSSEDTMNKWVEKLSQTFEEKIVRNTHTIMTRDTRGLSFSDGIVVVDLSLVEAAASSEICVKVDDRSSPHDLQVECCKQANLTVGSYKLVLVDSMRTSFQQTETVEDNVLSLLRNHSQSRLYLVHVDELPLTIRLLKENEGKNENQKTNCERLYSETFEGQRFDVRFIGCETTQLKEEGGEESVSREKLMKRVEHMKKSSLQQEVKLEVSKNGIRVWRPTTSPKRPFSVVVENSLFTILDCFNFDKVFAYLMFVNQGELSLQRFYAFKCVDKAMATKIRLLARSHCQSAFHALQKNTELVADRALQYGAGLEFQVDVHKTVSPNDAKAAVFSMSEKASLDLLLKMSGSDGEFTSVEDFKTMIEKGNA
eukprot:m.240740 g.240740  ORF g.240740 m.240740 type:complete len:465 (+) comp15895_c0_seq1:188-1582(+)